MEDKTDASQKQWLLLLSIFVIATCGLIYELIAGTLASYLLGDSITQFSLVIGIYLFSMGIGAYLSKFFTKNLLAWFVQIEILVGIVGGISSTLLFYAFEHLSGFQLILYFLIVLTGTLVGLEIPLLMRILKDRLEFSDMLSKVFTFDYIGALLASILFPLFMVPYLGLLKTSFLFGLLNVSIAIIVCYRFKNEGHLLKLLLKQAYLAAILLLLGLVFSDKIQSFAESLTYNETIIFSKSSAYQRIVVTKEKNHLKLYLNGNLQFNSFDEYRYHEALVHPVLSHHPNPKKILILGGGDGMALREVLKYPQTESITLVDLDSSVTDLFKHSELLSNLNLNSFNSNKLSLINTDAFTWIKQNKQHFDCIIIDFPDPSNFAVGKLYTNTFYKEVRKKLAPGGYCVVQSTSPYVAPKSFWCVNKTLHQAGLKTQPYHTYVPSFGEWGYIMAFENFKDSTYYLPQNLKFYTPASFKLLCEFPADMKMVNTEINKLNNQMLVHYFDKEWSKVL